MDTYILFVVGNSNYAIDTKWVQRIEMINQITHVPNTPAFMEGIFYLRGQVVPVLNLRTLFGLERRSPDLRSRLVVVQMNKRVVGLQVDSAREFIHFQAEQILPLPDDLAGPGVEYLQGIVSIEERLILVISLNQLLNREDRKALANSMTATEEIEGNTSERKSSHV
jgi:purine-binding chemotaxis protein CheW